jgi:hypothetical protein
LLESNDGQILRNAALDGLGILVLPSYVVYDDIVAGRLVPILNDWDLPRLMINIAYPTRRHLSAKVRSFVDFMVDEFASNGAEQKWTSYMGLRQGDGEALSDGEPNRFRNIASGYPASGV